MAYMTSLRALKINISERLPGLKTLNEITLNDKINPSNSLINTYFPNCK